MELHVEFVHTDELPQTTKVLKAHLPNIFKTICYNESKLSFAKEVKKTEIGHLFEHIFLSYLCNAKISQGAENPIFRGLTSWNWVREKRGVFHITLTSKNTYNEVFDDSLTQSINLLVKIFTQKNISFLQDDFNDKQASHHLFAGLN